MNKKLWGTILGVSMGVMLGKKMMPDTSKKIMKRTKKTTSSIIDGITDMWS